MTTQQDGYSGTPIKLRTNAGRQTEEQVSTRYHQHRTPRVVVDDENPDAWEAEKPHTSAVKYPLPQHKRTSLLPEYSKTTKMRRRRIDRPTLLIICCLAIIAMVLGWFLLSAVANWWQGVQENMKYGYPRTFQADQYVGLEDSPEHPDHFIALNLHGVIELIQINPQDRTKDAVYVLASVGNDSTPASLSFRDTTGDGRTDVIVTIGDSTPYTIVLLNNGKTLQPTQPAH